jgi:adenosylcobinamide-GDP ribazoletransferase
VQFLTQIPVHFKDYPDEKTAAASLIYYPLIGLLIGLALYLIAVLIGTSATMLSAALLLTFWVAITGALHMDGLADSCDAWIGGQGSKQRTLDIMKDPCSGPIAVVVLICMLLLKFSALVAIIESSQYWLLLVAPLIARSLLPLLLLATPYVRANGIGAALVKYAPQRAVYISCSIALFAVYLLSSLFVIISCFTALYLLRTMMMKRLAGLTGDTAGASLEIVETVALVAIVISIL